MISGFKGYFRWFMMRTSIRLQVFFLLIFSQLVAHAITVLIVSSGIISGGENKNQLQIDLSDAFLSVLAVLDPKTVSTSEAIAQLTTNDRRFELGNAPIGEFELIVSTALSDLIEDVLPTPWRGRVEARLLPETVKWPVPNVHPFALNAELADGTRLWYYPSPDALARALPLVASTLMVVLLGVPLAFLAIWAGTAIVKPIERLGRGADSFGLDAHSSPLVLDGPREVRSTIVAFNKMQSKLNRLIEERGQTLASIGHDMRTPLTRLKLRLENVELGDQLLGVQRDISALETLIDDALNFLRSESKYVELYPTNLNSLCQTIVDDFCDQGAKVELRCQTQIDAICDIPLTLRAMNNIVGNAVKYAGGAIINLGDGNKENFVEINVVDEGPGIALELRGIVQQPFNRLALIDAGSDGHVGGFGLGLAIARECMERQGGYLQLFGNKPSGLVVSLQLPRNRR